MNTAAMDGQSECPGEPCDTSIPSMIVGTLETTGIEGVCSTDNIEFNPPSCNKFKKNKGDVNGLKCSKQCFICQK